MDKKEFLDKLRKIADGEKYFRFQNSYWKVNKDKTINNCFEVMSWEYFFKIYDKLTKKEKDILDSELTEKGKTNDEKINLFIKILIGVSKKNNFYNILKQDLTPYKINVIIKKYYYSVIDYKSNSNTSLKEMFNALKNNSHIKLSLLFKLSSPNIFDDILYATYTILENDIIEYLKDNDIYHKFNNELYRNKYFDSFENYYKYCMKYKKDIFTFFIGSFSWSNSEEGYDYWKKIQDDFVKFIFKKLITHL